MKKEETEQEDLKRALALKRHEQPPPRFFNQFSDEVLDRLHHPQPSAPPSWTQRLGFGEDWKPFMVGVVAIVCLILAVGLISAYVVKKPEPQLNEARPEDQVYAPTATTHADAVPPGFTPVEGGEGDPTVVQPVMAPEGGP